MQQQSLGKIHTKQMLIYGKKKQEEKRLKISQTSRMYNMVRKQKIF